MEYYYIVRVRVNQKSRRLKLIDFTSSYTNGEDVSKDFIEKNKIVPIGIYDGSKGLPCESSLMFGLHTLKLNIQC